MKNVILIIGLVFHSLAVAGWSVNKNIDAMTDEIKKTAIIKNELGHTFSIYRISKNGPVWGNFSLSERLFDQVDWENPPIFRIDKNTAINLADKKKTQEMGLGIQAYLWEPKWVNFLIWHGKENEGVADSLVQIMEGTEVVFRYYLSTGGYKDTSFPLKGASAAVSEAVGISSEVNHSAQKSSKMFRMNLISEVKKCRQKRSTQMTCSRKVLDCGKQANNDILVFNTCLE